MAEIPAKLRKQRRQLEIQVAHGPGMCGAVCSQAFITVQNTPEDGAKYLNQGAPYGTKEWQEQYHRRNTIESRNDRAKSSRHQGHGDPTMRLMRGWAAQAISAVMSAVAANIGLLSAESRWRFPKKPTPPTSLRAVARPADATRLALTLSPTRHRSRHSPTKAAGWSPKMRTKPVA